MTFSNQIEPVAHSGITPYLKQFLEWSAAMNYSSDTRRKREYSICKFIRWCDPRGLDRPHDITSAVLERYRKYLYYYRKPDGEPLSFSTQHSHLAPLKAFFKWLAKENHILFNPASEFELPKVPKHLPKYILTYEEIESILQHTQVYGDIGIRDRAMIETFYSTGIRRKELAAIKLHDIDLVRGTLVVFEGKGQRDRVIPVGDRACAWIRKYLNEVRPSLMVGDDPGFLFLTDYGEPFVKNRITDLIKKYLDAVGIDKPGACHLFRHAMATHMLENGADIRYIQMMLGHANLNTTEIYTRVSIKKLKAVHAATHPAT
ncbi:MAG: site-specific tyrosine recombinase XerC [Gammaproteobacteria bacterium]|nr:site-specific tyrosine recombinase XerC [Gammaproteobacteria bacterium]